MNYEFKIIFDLYDEKIVEGKDPEWILVKKNLTKKWLVDIHDLKDVRETLSSKGKLLKDRCDVFSKSDNRWVTIKEPYSKVKRLLNKPYKVVKVRGFKK